VNGRLVKLAGHRGHPRNKGLVRPKGRAKKISFYDSYRSKPSLKKVNEKGVLGEWVYITKGWMAFDDLNVRMLL
jgi:hypothetical protein